jgi:hypothetical protein
MTINIDKLTEAELIDLNHRICERFCFLFIVTLCLILPGCVMPSRDFLAVWTQQTAPPTDLPAPDGFAVTPSQAYSVVRDAHALSLKHVWHIYADSQYYYVHDIFLSDSPRRAFTQGVLIDGQTGEIVRR